MQYVVKIEGQDIPVDETIGASDETVKRALAPFFPDAANALITRTAKDDVTTITVVKRAGPKGASNQTPLTHLLNCPGGKNPVIALYEEIAGADGNAVMPSDPEQILGVNSRIDEAIEAGEKQRQAVESARKRLDSARPVPAPVLVLGF